MKSKKNYLKGIVIVAIVLLISIPVYLYFNPTFTTLKRKCCKYNATAKETYHYAQEVIDNFTENGIEIPADCSISSEDKYSTNWDGYEDFKNALYDKTGACEDGVWYIQIKDSKVEEVYYSDWIYSNITGSYPNGSCEFSITKKVLEAQCNRNN